jgi:hypothetical protein
MALEHIPKGSNPIVKARPAADTTGLGMGDLDMIDIVPIPKGLEQKIGESEYQHILDRALA